MKAPVVIFLCFVAISLSRSAPVNEAREYDSKQQNILSHFGLNNAAKKRSLVPNVYDATKNDPAGWGISYTHGKRDEGQNTLGGFGLNADADKRRFPPFVNVYDAKNDPAGWGIHYEIGKRDEGQIARNYLASRFNNAFKEVPLPFWKMNDAKNGWGVDLRKRNEELKQNDENGI